MRRATIRLLASLALAAAPALGHAADGAAVYKAQCAACHGEEGQADTALSKALHVPALAGNKNVAALSVGAVAKVVKESPKHVSFKSKLGADDLQAVAAHVKTLAADD